MKFDVYAVKDLEKGSYAMPFFVQDGTPVDDVIINFKRLIEKGDSEISYFPDRFEFHRLSQFDSVEGIFYNFDGDTCIAKGIDFAKPEYLEALKKIKFEMENTEKVD